MATLPVEFLYASVQEPRGKGTPGRIRTCDLRISVPLQLSLRVFLCGLDFIFIPEAPGMWCVKSLRNLEIVRGEINVLSLIVLWRLNPQTDCFAKLIRRQIIATVRIRTVYAINVDTVFVHLLSVKPVRVTVTTPKMNSYSASVFACGPVLDLNSFAATVLVGYQIERRVLRKGYRDDVSLLVQINLDLKNSQVSGVLGMMLVHGSRPILS